MAYIEKTGTLIDWLHAAWQQNEGQSVVLDGKIELFGSICKEAIRNLAENEFLSGIRWHSGNEKPPKSGFYFVMMLDSWAVHDEKNFFSRGSVYPCVLKYDFYLDDWLVDHDEMRVEAWMPVPHWDYTAEENYA